VRDARLKARVTRFVSREARQLYFAVFLSAATARLTADFRRAGRRVPPVSSHKVIDFSFINRLKSRQQF
jgi:hypothetical protein